MPWRLLIFVRMQKKYRNIDCSTRPIYRANVSSKSLVSRKRRRRNIQLICFLPLVWVQLHDPLDTNSIQTTVDRAGRGKQKILTYPSRNLPKLNYDTNFHFRGISENFAAYLEHENRNLNGKLPFIVRYYQAIITVCGQWHNWPLINHSLSHERC